MKPIAWDIHRKGRTWSNEEFDKRIYQAPEKIEYVDGIFASDRERLNVMGMLLENLGIDKVVRFGKIDRLAEKTCNAKTWKTTSVQCVNRIRP